MSQVSTTSQVQPERVELILGQLDQLPTLPVIATRILQATSSEDSSAADVIQLIESDQSLSAKVLTMVNSALVGAPRNVETVDKAVVLLGFDAIRHAVLSMKVYEMLANIDGAESHFDRTEFWKHSLAVACCCHLVAERWPGHIDPEVAFVCGLLHDLGKIALDVCLPKSYDRVVDHAQKRQVSTIEVEQELLGLDHTIAGKRLAQRWSLPGSLQECLWLHHHTPDMLPDSVTNPDLISIVTLSNTFVREQRLGFLSYFSHDVSSREIARQMGMPIEHLDQVGAQLLDMINRRASLLGLDDMTPGQMFSEAVSQANQELAKLNDQLSRSNRLLASRSNYLEVVHEFNTALKPAHRLPDICKLGTSSAKRLLRLPAVAVFTCSPQSRTLYVAVEDTFGQLAEVICIEDESTLNWDTISDQGGLILAPPATAPIRERFGERLGAAPHWMLPIVKDGQVWGGVLFHASKGQANNWKRHTAELNIFTTALANALIQGHERFREERLNEGLALVNRQLKKAQVELLSARSLSMIGEMAAGAAHELNNPLAVIAGRADMMASVAENEKLKKDLGIIREQAKRASDIVNDLMAFAKPDPPEKQRINIAKLLKMLVDAWVEKSSLTNEQITLTISDEETHILADPRQVEGIFEELIKNAYEGCTPENANLSINCLTDPTDEKVTVVLRDNGCGMSSEVLEKCKDPFFSYRVAGRGRGLGLSRAVRWCQVNGIKLRLESQPDQGTQVFLQFPPASR